MLAHYPTVHLVINALDKCRDSNGTRRQFLAMLQELQKGQDIRLIATSRFILEVVDKFIEALRLEVQASKKDVKRFVASQTDQLLRCI